jgi:ABC-type transport system involved in multi-copper enzyme maturation permease subunit
MTESMLLGFVSPTTSNWLTPIWLIGVGALIGLAVLVVMWIVAFALSRVPALDAAVATPSKRNQVGFGLSVIVFAIILAMGYSSGVFTPQQVAGQAQRNDAPMILLLSAVLSILIGFILVTCLSRRAVDEVPDAVREGPLWPIFLMTAMLAVFGVFGYFVATTPREILASLSRLPYSGTREYQFTIAAAPQELLDDPSRDPPQTPIEIDFWRSELVRLSILGSENLSFDVKESQELDVKPLFKTQSNDSLDWVKTDQSVSPFQEERVTRLWVRNYGAKDAALKITIQTAPPHREVRSIVITALAVMGIFLMVLLTGIVALLVFIYLPFNTLGEDIKVLKDSGMTLIMVLGIIQAIWAASTSISEEIDGRTALTVLSKPIGRRSFIIGKYLGIIWTLAVIFVILGVIFMVVVAYKPVYDARETSKDEKEAANWMVCHFEMVGVVPGLVLAFLETAVLAALSVAVSTRLPMLANFIICFSIYVMGHLTPLIVQSSVGRFAPVQFVAELLSAVLPILDHFNITAAVATGTTVPYHYLGWALVYSFLYGVIALLLALLLFEDRDLA